MFFPSTMGKNSRGDDTSVGSIIQCRVPSVLTFRFSSRAEGGSRRRERSRLATEQERPAEFVPARTTFIHERCVGNARARRSGGLFRSNSRRGEKNLFIVPGRRLAGVETGTPGFPFDRHYIPCFRCSALSRDACEHAPRISTR